MSSVLTACTQEAGYAWAQLQASGRAGHSAHEPRMPRSAELWGLSAALPAGWDLGTGVSWQCQPWEPDDFTGPGGGSGAWD